MLLSLCSCMRVSRQVRTEVDSLCMEAYAVRYTDIDSSRNAAQRAFEAARAYPDGQARALNRMAYVRYQRMDYDGTLAATDSVYDLCNHQVLLLSADVMRMKVFQRVGDGRGFYEARSSALKRLKRINEDVEQLDEADMAEYHYAWTEFHIISSTYFYYQERHKIKDLYRYYGTSQKKYMAELEKQKPPLVKMLDALDKKARMKAEEKKSGAIGKEFVW